VHKVYYIVPSNTLSAPVLPDALQVAHHVPMAAHVPRPVTERVQQRCRAVLVPAVRVELLELALRIQYR